MNTNNMLDFIAPLLKINPVTAMIYNMNKSREGFIGTEEENYNMPTMPSMPSSMTMPIPMPPMPVQMPPMPPMPTMPSMSNMSSTNSYNNPALPYIPSPPYVPNNVQTTGGERNSFKESTTFASVISNIFYTAMMIYALYISFKCNSGFNFGSFLLALCCSPFYIAYRLAVPCTNTLVNTSRYYR